MGLNISVLRKEEENFLIFALTGSLDTETHEQFRKKVLQHLDSGAKGIVLDLKNLDYISSLGISAILDIRQETEKRNVSLSFAQVPAHIEQVFKIVNALPNVQVFASIQEADKYFREIQDRIKNG